MFNELASEGDIETKWLRSVVITESDLQLSSTQGGVMSAQSFFSPPRNLLHLMSGGAVVKECFQAFEINMKNRHFM